ncbi:hypothetical protein FLL45_13680 [Aliikangiella marina]|uniref:Uncharacterized protein n=1 Tax=Aliikangiella marina TaxID=1712262 RepID=A0A545T9L3_9GAMM|nr:hypothetical protein [Aliikangiella marina]TQV73910.1 hypothetical protein FLL45_13680 [Aliikangiella marina]
MKARIKNWLLFFTLSIVSHTAWAAQDYNSSRSNTTSARESVELVLAKILKDIQREIATGIKKELANQSSRIKGAAPDMRMTLTVKISPKGSSRAQYYNSSRSNNINGHSGGLATELKKRLSTMQSQIIKEFRKKHPKPRTKNNRMPDSFFDIWVDVRVAKQPGKARRINKR